MHEGNSPDTEYNIIIINSNVRMHEINISLKLLNKWILNNFVFRYFLFNELRFALCFV